MMDDPMASTATGMPAKVRAWLDYELAYAAYWAGRTTTEAGEMPDDPSVDELCAALPHAGDQLERVKIIGQLRSQLYNGEDLIIGELYLAAQEFPERMDHMYDYMYAASSVRKELGPDVVRWLRDLGEFGHEGIDTETAEVMVRALHMEDEWDAILADWGELVPAHLVERTIWHDGHWRHKDSELVLLHEAEAEAVRSRHATPEQLAEWKTEWQAWPRPVKTDQAGPWVVAEDWREFLRLKNVDDATLSGATRQATEQAARLRERLAAVREREEKTQREYDEAEQRAGRLSREWRMRTGPVMREMSPAQVESAIEWNEGERT